MFSVEGVSLPSAKRYAPSEDLTESYDKYVSESETQTIEVAVNEVTGEITFEDTPYLDLGSRIDFQLDYQSDLHDAW